MRETRSAAFLALLFVCALPAFATRFDDIDITVRNGFGKPKTGHYYEQRLGVANRSGNAHSVKITLESQMARGGASRATRTVQIPPHSETVVTLPFLVIGYYTPNEATVEIDGREQNEKVLLTQLSAWEESTNPDVLLSRSVRYDVQPSSIDIERPEVAPGEWSTSWIQYDRFAAVAVSASDWTQLPPAVHDALFRWTFAGGVLMFVDKPDPMPAVSVRSTEGRYGLGRILVFDDGLFYDSRLSPLLQSRGNDASFFNTATGELPLLKDEQVPLRGLYIGLIVFAIAGGPLSIFLLAKKNRRMWIFGTLPFFAIVTSVFLIGATFASEGWVKIQRSVTITYLDETLGRATTLGLTGFYATVSPRGEIRFAPDTELRVNSDYRSPINGDTTWDDGQRLFGGWVGTRVPTYFAVRKSEPRRERMPLQFSAAGVSGVNGLGGTIEKVWVANGKGEVFEAKNVAPGAAFTLTRTTASLPETTSHAAERILDADVRLTILGNIDQHPRHLLQRGTYLAYVRDAPFHEKAMDNATTMDRRGIVFGVSRLEGGADAR
ncbi:MAG TPA: hypothetical protein VHW00_18180 [Thermoanaerobaculia bacterium]|nr:hypothetical protein [Thermoanaerobaculia bacterium]